MPFPKRYCFTINNYTEEDIRHLEKIDVQYLIYGREVAPTTGTPHLQGYVEFKRPTRMKTANRSLGGKCAVKVARGSAEQNIDYCSKEDEDPVIRGEPLVGQGSRSDLDDVKSAIIDGTITNQWDLITSVRSFAAFGLGSKMLAMMNPPKRVPPKVYWLYGSTGTGKSKAADDFSELQAGKGWRTWRSFDCNFKWFDGYCGQKLAIFDDFRATGIPISRVLRTFDRYPMQCEVKGSVTWWCPLVIVVTTPHAVEPTFAEAKAGSSGVSEFTGEDLTQLTRRVTREFNFDEDGLKEWKECIVQYTE